MIAVSLVQAPEVKYCIQPIRSLHNLEFICSSSQHLSGTSQNDAAGNL